LDLFQLDQPWLPAGGLQSRSSNAHPPVWRGRSRRASEHPRPAGPRRRLASEPRSPVAALPLSPAAALPPSPTVAAPPSSRPPAAAAFDQQPSEGARESEERWTRITGLGFSKAEA